MLHFGGALVGIGEVWLLVPLKLTTGGFNGIGMLMYYILDIPIYLVSLFLNIPLFLVATKVLGVKYSLRTLVSMLSLSWTLNVCASWSPLTSDILLATLFGSIIVGIGIAIAIKGESTTGGTDLLAKLIQAKFKHLNLGEILLIIDGIIIAAAAITFESIEVALYSGIAVWIMSKTIDFILDGGKYAKALLVITDKNKEVADYIMNDVKRGVTFLNGKGAYSGDEKNIIFCVANNREIPKIKDKIKEIDENAFIVVTTVAEAIGQGFSAKV